MDILNYMNTGICIMDEKLNIVYLNHKAICIFGEKSASLKGKSYANLILPHFPDNLKDVNKLPVIFSIKNKREFNYTINVNNGPNTKFAVECLVSPIFNEQGNMIGAVETYITGNLVNQKIERIQMQKLMSSFISDSAMAYITEKTHQSESATAMKKYKTIVFIDIVGFTTLSEKYEPNIVITILNHFYQNIYATIKEFEGDISKFIGDAMLLIFSNTENAVRCATDIILKDLPIINAQIYKRYGEKLEIHVGINSGWVIVGELGAFLRKDYTAIGDNVNIASRIQSLTPPNEVWVSGSAMANLGKLGLLFKQIDTLNVKGKKKPLTLYKFEPEKLSVSKRVLVYEKSKDIKSDLKFRLRRMGVKEITIVENEKEFEREAQIDFDNMIVGPSAKFDELPKLKSILKRLGKEKEMVVHIAKDVSSKSIAALKKIGIHAIVYYDDLKSLDKSLEQALKSNQITKIDHKKQITEKEREILSKKTKEEIKNKQLLNVSGFQLSSEKNKIFIEISKILINEEIEALVLQLERIWIFEQKENTDAKIYINIIKITTHIEKDFLEKIMLSLYESKKLNLHTWQKDVLFLVSNNTELKLQFKNILNEIINDYKELQKPDLVI
ncbi:MAG: PAS domain-containing protein [Spirochaetia bacterium]|nr:PAS domain-containing protein [Spirochaetia bacterium]